MSGAQADVEARIETVRKLSDVISAMRGIAAAHSQEAHRHLDAIRAYAASLRDAIGLALSFAPPPEAGETAGTGREALVLLVAEQSFAGSFSEKVIETARTLPGASRAAILVVGTRGLRSTEEAGLAVDWHAPMVTHPSQAATLAGRITDAIYERLAHGEITGVSIVHALPGGLSTGSATSKRLVPFDYSPFHAQRPTVPPLLTLPPERLFAQLAEEYVFAEIDEAVMLSFAAENDARMRAMISAHDKVADALDELVGTSRRLRQSSITEEIIELAAGSRAAG